MQGRLSYIHLNPFEYQEAERMDCYFFQLYSEFEALGDIQLVVNCLNIIGDITALLRAVPPFPI